MNTFRRIPVTLVLVDAGPLISLAACGRLDLLDSFDKKVRVVDVVKWTAQIDGIGPVHPRAPKVQDLPLCFADLWIASA